MTASDSLGNVGHSINSGSDLEIYNTILPTPPGQPVNFHASSLAAGKIRLDWSPVANAEIYRQEFRDESNEVVIRCHIPKHLLHHIAGPTVKVRFVGEGYDQTREFNVGDAKHVLHHLAGMVAPVAAETRAAYLEQLAAWKAESLGSSWHGSGAWRDGWGWRAPWIYGTRRWPRRRSSWDISARRFCCR